MPYFDPENAAHLALLSPSIRADSAEVRNVAPIVEREVLAMFTKKGHGAAVTYIAASPRAYAVSLSLDLWLCLAGYDPDPALATGGTDGPLASALRETIAGVLSFRMAQRRTSPLESSSSAADGGKMISFREDRNRRFPDGWDVALRPYDIRPPAVAI